MGQPRRALVPPAYHRSGSDAACSDSVPELIAAIEEYMAVHNEDPRPFVWTASAEAIIAKVARARATLDTVN